MVLVCAWCGKVIVPWLPATAPATDGRVSHGICRDCLDKEFIDEVVAQTLEQLEPLDPRD